MSTKTYKSARATRYDEIRKEMAALGYDAMRPMYLTKWTFYRIVLVLVNHLAFVLHKLPYRVYQCAWLRAHRTLRGIPYNQDRQAKPAQGGPLEGEKEAGIAVVCPYCHKNLLDAGPVTKEEVLAEINARRKIRKELLEKAGSPQK